MTFTAISDTHGLHHQLQLPKSDAIIHAGDFCDYGNDDHLYDFLDWFNDLDFEHKILIGGNHDFFADRHPDQFSALLPPDIIYLNDSGYEINGISIWGSPVNPDLVGWAFGKQRGADMKVHWDLIPESTNLLITHTPPEGILDLPSSGGSLGCEELLERILDVEPSVHVFGHVHASYGQDQQDHTLFINASNMNSELGLVNPPVCFELNAQRI